MESFKPTYLYIKQHSITGKLYFGKTSKNPEIYNGSGLKWTKHYSHHGKQYIQTLWYCLFLDEKSINDFALSFSRQNDIVKSNEWLNLIEETGLGATERSITSRQRMSESQRGNTNRRGKVHTVEANEKNRLAHLGKKANETTLEKMRQYSHPQTEEVKQRIKMTLTGKKHDDERILKMKLSKSSKNLKWYTNGEEAMLFPLDTAPDGWCLGRKLVKLT